MTSRLNGKSAIVTGGTRGIGRAIVELFRREGADVLFTGRDEAMGREVARACGAHFFAADAADTAQVARISEVADEKFGRLDILVNNAGHSGPRESMDTFDQEAFELIHRGAAARAMAIDVALRRLRATASAHHPSPMR